MKRQKKICHKLAFRGKKIGLYKRTNSCPLNYEEGFS